MVVSVFFKYIGEENWEFFQKRFFNYVTEEKFVGFKGVFVKKGKDSFVSVSFL